MKIWMCEDRSDPKQSGFAKTKRDAMAYVTGNRGYDDYTGERFGECAADGWAQYPVQISVPRPVALVLLDACRV